MGTAMRLCMDSVDHTRCDTSHRLCIHTHTHTSTHAHTTITHAIASSVIVICFGGIHVGCGDGHVAMPSLHL